MNDTLLIFLLIGAFFVLPLLLTLACMGVFHKKNRANRIPPPPFTIAVCPWCRSKIDLLPNAGTNFACPICQCEFRRDWQKWALAIACALVVAVGLGLVANKFFGPHIVLIAVAVAAWCTKELPMYRIIIRGTNPRPAPTLSNPVRAYFSQLRQKKASEHR